MLDFLAQSNNFPFSLSLAVMLILALLEGAGLVLGAAFSSLLETLIPGMDADIDAPDTPSASAISRLLGWLYIGQVPFLVILIILLTFFGLSGLVVQSIYGSITGNLMYNWLAVVPATMIALPLTRFSAKGIAALLPQDETEAVSSKSFIGRVATITTGTAKPGYPAQAKLQDEYGLSHYVMVEPDQNQPEQPQGSQVLIVKQQNNVFIVIPNTNPHLVDQ